MRISFDTLIPLGYQQLTNLNTAQKLTVPAGANCCLLSVKTQDVRWRDDGTAPTSTVGMILSAGGELDYSGDLTMIQFILASGSPILDVTYYA